MYPWGHERRFNSYTQYFKHHFGERVQKLTIDAGFTCPNRDGKIGYGGCSYCNNDTFNPSYCDSAKSIKWQISEGIEFHQKRYKNPTKHLAYFQAYSNTYSDIEHLKDVYNQALSSESVIGLVIGTRPDCVDDEKLDFLAELSEKYYIIVEYGVESCYNKTLAKINRGHNFETSTNAIIKTAQRGIKTGIHLMFGLPGETREEMLYQSQIISELPIHTIKFHQLQITKNTKFEKDFLENPNKFNLFGKYEYIDFIISFIERLNPQIIIERFASESKEELVVAPDWGKFRYYEIVETIDRELEKRNTWQGRLY